MNTLILIIVPLVPFCWIFSALTENAHSNVTGDEEKSKSSVETEACCTPKPLMNSQKKLVSDKKRQTAKKIASMVRNPSVLKLKNSSAGTPNLVLENQAIKRQKLDGARSRQVLLLPFACC